MSVALRAYAKINLGLHVLRRRPDGYHDLCTVMHRVDLADEITLEPADRITVETTSREAQGDETNLCFRAARLVQQELGTHNGVRIGLLKRIPVGAGLGGGSSDAASVLTALPALLGAQLPDAVLHRLASRLGSDIPYFLRRGTALATGRGEILQYFDLDVPFTILLCHPGIPVSTAKAYQAVRPSGAAPPDLPGLLRRGMSDPGLLRRELINDFEPPVFAMHPSLRELRDGLLHAGAVYASLTGSGSTVYGFFTEMETAAAAASRWEAEGIRTSLTPPHFHPAGDGAA